MNQDVKDIVSGKGVNKAHTIIANFEARIVKTKDK
jgi:hypothetical protein